MKYNGDNVYFSELTSSQLEPNGKGLGTFAQNGSVSNPDQPAAPETGVVSEGSLLKYVGYV